MSERRSMLRGAMLLFAGHGAGQVLGLVRNFAVAHLVSPEDFGIAATFAATLSVLQAASELGWDKFLIQNKDGENPLLMDVLHSLTMARGVLLAILMFALAGPLARLFEVPEATTSFELLALVPLLRGGMHHDPKRLQRNLSFGPEVNVTLAGQFVGMVVAIGLALWLRDYRAMLWGLIAQSLVTLIGTHLVAERRYRLGADGPLTRQVFAFGWPLLLNGLVIVASAQGDRLLVGAQLGVRELGIYAAAVMLLDAPSLLLTRVTGGVTLPWLASKQTEPVIFAHRYLLLVAGVALASAVLYAPLILLGAHLVVLIFGESYAPPAYMAGLIAATGGLRLIRAWTVVTALALGDTKNILFVNIARLTGLALGAVWLWFGGSVVHVALAVLVGELISLAVSFVRLRRFGDLDHWQAVKVVMACLASFAAALGLLVLIEGNPGEIGYELVLSVLLAGLAALTIIALSPPMRRLTGEALARLR